jgi:hypothetical protein
LIDLALDFDFARDLVTVEAFAALAARRSGSSYAS